MKSIKRQTGGGKTDEPSNFHTNLQIQILIRMTLPMSLDWPGRRMPVLRAKDGECVMPGARSPGVASHQGC